MPTKPGKSSSLKKPNTMKKPAMKVLIMSVAANDRVDVARSLAIVFIAKRAKVVVSFADMLQFPRHEFDHDDVVEIADHGNLVRQNVFGIREVDERGEQPFAVGGGKLPFHVRQHAEQRFEFRDSLPDKVGQGFALADFIEYVPDDFHDFCFVCVAHRSARHAECLAEKKQVPVREFECDAESHMRRLTATPYRGQRAMVYHMERQLGQGL